MDDLTPMDPEYREAVPETPQSSPGYYGTGRQPEKRPSHLPVIIVLICLLAAANFVTIFALLELKRTHDTPAAPNSLGALVALNPTGESASPSESGINSGDMILQQESDSVLSLPELYKKVVPSVVTVFTGTDGAAGTGVVLSEDGYVITNAHAAAQASALRISTSDGTVYEAALVGCDTASDLALLKADAAGLTPAEFGDSDLLETGDSVVAVSHPFGQTLGEATMSQGIVSAINKNVNLSGRTVSLLQTNAALDADGSGGPLFNASGQVIGFNVAHAGTLVSYESVPAIGFAIPTRDVKSLLRELLNSSGKETTVSLGLEVMDIPKGSRVYWKLPAGVMIRSLPEDSSAYASGLRAGDIIVRIGEEAVQSVQDYDEILKTVSAGQSIRIYIYRGGSLYYADVVTSAE